MARVEEVTENEENKENLANLENKKNKEKVKAKKVKIGTTKINKYDIDLGCCRFKVFRVNAERELNLNVFDGDFVSIRNRTAENPRKPCRECCCDASTSSGGGGGHEESTTSYGSQIPPSRGWKALDDDPKLYDEDVGCRLM